MTVGPALLRQLYGAPPDAFTAVRDAAVAEAKARGDAAAAKEIAALRKPTIAAWLVNLLAIRRPELLADLAALAGEMRTAQRELRGAELRELSAQRRRVVASLVTEVRKLAAGSGAETGKLPLAEVEDTLNAALSDEQIAESVRSGRLLRPVTYAGFGEVPRPRLRLVTEDAGSEGGVPSGAGEGPAGGPEDGAGDGVRGPRRASHDGSRADGRAGSRGAGHDGSRGAGHDGSRVGAHDGSRAGSDDGSEGGSRTGVRSARAASHADRSRTAAAERTARAEEARRSSARRVLERAEREALRAHERAQADLTAAEQAEREAAAAITTLTERIAALQAERAEAEQEAARRKLARKTAERAAAAARRRHGDAAAVLEAAPSPVEEPFVEPAAPFADTVTRKGAARRGRADRGGAPKAESGA